MADLPPTNSQSEAWLAWVFREWQERQLAVNTELYRVVERITDRLNDLERVVENRKGRDVVVVWIFGIIVPALIAGLVALFIKKL